MQRVQITGGRFNPVVPEGARAIGRNTRLGNPYKVIANGGTYTLEESLALYERDLRADNLFVNDRQRVPTTQAEIRATLAGYTAVACRCPLDSRCHGDVLIEVLGL